MRARPFIKRLVYPMLKVASVFRRARTTVPERADLREVMVVQLGLLGDVLLISPLVQRLRDTLPEGARITLVVPPSSRAVADGIAGVDVVETYDAFWADPSHDHRHAFGIRHVMESWRFVRRNRRVTHDLVINCWMMDQPLTPMLLSFLESRCVVGFDFTYSAAFTDVTWPFNRNAHISDSVLAMYDGVLGLPPTTGVPRLQYTIPADDADTTGGGVEPGIAWPYVVVSPFSSERAKEWDLSHWATVLNAFSAAHPQATIVLTGLPEARERSAALAAVVAGRLENAVGTQTFGQFAQLVKNATAILTTDSGAMHLASAFDIPVFVLFSQIYNYRQYVPYHVINDFSVVPVSCAECVYGCAAVACMKHDVDTVLGQIRRFCAGIPALSVVSGQPT